MPELGDGTTVDEAISFNGIEIRRQNSASGALIISDDAYAHMLAFERLIIEVRRIQ